MTIGRLLLALCVAAGPAVSGEIQELGGFDAECTYKFTGQVAPGDTRKIAALNTYGSAGASLCLDSPGGSLPEGIKMFNEIWNSQMHTRVVAGDTCESACAIAWLGGGVQEGTLAIRFASRSIEPGGVLGFHAPRLDLPVGTTYPAEDVEKAFRIALKSAEDYFRIKQTTDDSVDALNDFLYARILETPGDSMFRIQSLAEALMANVEVTAVKAPETLRKANLIYLCENAFLVDRGVDVSLPDAAAHLQRLRDTAEAGERVGYINEKYWAVRMDHFRRNTNLCILRDSSLGHFLKSTKRYNADTTYPNGRPYFPTVEVSFAAVNIQTNAPSEKVWQALKELDGENGLGIRGVSLPHYAVFDGLTSLVDLPRH
ncbi:hypothetical protein ANTHELSMS3_00246 [Antarctobacter heliothermus]|uniref:Periplasmic protein n=1 Tax=Antarctobacter heliothermus TaxID=74033 RepID=A0A222DZ40_9RHOB|nr:hypothetical protein [Antarctobacter heliothermus]ASP18971.1 hypothetical protein ANTHELSMS3_00246 [Antarctobacter heliothermus]